jgi:site-specific recombinase XerD
MQESYTSRNFYDRSGGSETKWSDALARALTEKKITQNEHRIICEYVDHVMVKNGGDISPSRKFSIVSSLIRMRSYLKRSYTIVKDEAVNSAITNYNQTSNLKNSTQRTTLVSFKAFLKYLRDTNRNKTLTMLCIDNIKINPVKQDNDKIVLTLEEREKLHAVLPTLRDKLLFSMLYESGGRINEIVLLKWSHIVIEENHAVICVKSKTKELKKALIKDSFQMLSEWKNTYPNNQSGCENQYVFFGWSTKPEKPISYSAIMKILDNACKEAEIEKKVTPHAFRHSRATDLMNQGIPEQHIKNLLWGNTDSSMLKTYNQMTPDDTVSFFKGVVSPTKQREEPPTRTPNIDGDITEPFIQCPCGHKNRITAKFCDECGKPFPRI